MKNNPDVDRFNSGIFSSSPQLSKTSTSTSTGRVTLMNPSSDSPAHRIEYPSTYPGTGSRYLHPLFPYDWYSQPHAKTSSILSPSLPPPIPGGGIRRRVRCRQPRFSGRPQRAPMTVDGISVVPATGRSCHRQGTRTRHA